MRKITTALIAGAIGLTSLTACGSHHEQASKPAAHTNPCPTGQAETVDGCVSTAVPELPTLEVGKTVTASFWSDSAQGTAQQAYTLRKLKSAHTIPDKTYGDATAQGTFVCAELQIANTGTTTGDIDLSPELVSADGTVQDLTGSADGNVCSGLGMQQSINTEPAPGQKTIGSVAVDIPTGVTGTLVFHAGEGRSLFRINIPQ